MEWGGKAPAHAAARKTRAAALTERTPHAVREKRKHRETSKKKKTKTPNGGIEKRARERNHRGEHKCTELKKANNKIDDDMYCLVENLMTDTPKSRAHTREHRSDIKRNGLRGVFQVANYVLYHL